ncbi:hypothetical protein ACFQ6C_33995, partial [Streptomyces sp. NPDC056454]
LGDDRPPLGGPADELRVEEGGVVLCRADGTVIWRDGEPVAEPSASPGPPSQGGPVKNLPDTDETLLIRTDFSDLDRASSTTNQAHSAEARLATD